MCINAIWTCATHTLTGHGLRLRVAYRTFDGSAWQTIRQATGVAHTYNALLLRCPPRLEFE